MKAPDGKTWALLAVVLGVIGLGAWLNRPLDRPTPAAPSLAPAASAPPAAPPPAATGTPAPAGRPPPEPAAPAVAPPPGDPDGPQAQSAEDYRRARQGPDLADCAAAANDPNDLCRYTQPRFLSDWTRARDGDINAARRLALCMGSGCNGAIRAAPVEGCAWSLLIDRVRLGLDETDKAYVAMNCSGLSRADVEQARDRASDLAGDVHLRDAD